MKDKSTSQYQKGSNIILEMCLYYQLAFSFVLILDDEVSHLYVVQDPYAIQEHDNLQ